MVVQVGARNADGSTDTVRYSMKSVPVRMGTPLFAINPTSGVITTTMTNVLDREEVSVYNVMVQARNQGSSAKPGKTILFLLSF